MTPPVLAIRDLTVAYRHDGFWCMDTFKEHQQLSDMHREGNAPWEVWKGSR